jgi:hypothetical protein
MKQYKNLILFLLVIFYFSACDGNNDPSVDDNFLNFEIPQVKVIEDFSVGVYYFNPGASGQDAVRYGRLSEERDIDAKKTGPYVDFVLGNYKIDQDVNKITDGMIDIVQQHVDWCISGGVDFLILPALRAQKDSLAPDCINLDYRFYDLVTGKNPSSIDVGGTEKRVDMKTLKYAMTINMEDPISLNYWPTYKEDGTLTGTNTITLSNTALLEDQNLLVAYVNGKAYSRTDMFAEFFKSLTRYFKDGQYFRVDGKPLVVLQGAHKLYSRDCKAFYTALRQAVRDYSGEELYIVAQQDAWSPPARFEYFYKNCVEAVTHKNMYHQGDWNRSLLYPQFIYLNWEYSRNYFRDNWNSTDYIPTGSVAFSGYVDNGSYDKPSVNFDENTFRTMCNVMKCQAGASRIVFLDSFNQIQYSSFLEPTKEDYGNGFGTKFLDIVKEEFKK